MNWGERLKELIDEKEINQKEFADMFNLSKTTVTNYIKNNRTPSDDLKDKFANFFNVSVDYLMGRTEERNGNHLMDVKIKKIHPDFFKALKKMPDNLQKDYYKMSEDMKKRKRASWGYPDIEIENKKIAIDKIESELNKSDNPANILLVSDVLKALNDKTLPDGIIKELLDLSKKKAK